MITTLHRNIRKKSSLIRMLSKFLSFQISLQFLNLLFGFLIIRFLPKEEYAKYSITFSFQSVVNVLIELGFSSSLMAFAGSDYNDRVRAGQYLQVVKHYRQRLFFFALPLSVVFFFLLVSKYEWHVFEYILLFSSIVVYLVAQGWSAYYSPFLLLHQSHSLFYRPQLTSSFIKNILLVLTHLFNASNSLIAAWLNTLSLLFNGWRFKNHSKDYYVATNQIDPYKKEEIKKYLLPFIPGIVFWAIQGQISVFIISFFGNSKDVADVAALGRLSQIFVLLTAFQSVVIVPLMAKITGKAFVNLLTKVTIGSVCTSVTIALLAFLFPSIFLYVLGPSYFNLREEVGFMLISGAVSYLAGVFYSVQVIKKWVYWWHSIANIFLIIVIQITIVLLYKVDTTLGIALLSIFTNLVCLLTNLFVCVYSLYIQKHLVNKADCLSLESEE